MNVLALFPVIVGVIIIHFGFLLSFKVEDGFKRKIIKILSVIVGFISITLLSVDVNTSVIAGRYFIFVGLGYLLLYLFFIKKRWQMRYDKNVSK